MIPQLRLVVKSLLISAACAQALDAANVARHKPKCGGFRPSQELPVLDIIGDTATIVGHTPNFTDPSLNVASYSPNITSETYNVTSQTNNITSETDNITNQRINIVNNIIQCDISSLSSREPAEISETLPLGHNITKRQSVRRHSIPTYITVLAKDYTAAGGYLTVWLCVLQLLIPCMKNMYLHKPGQSNRT